MSAFTLAKFRNITLLAFILMAAIGQHQMDSAVVTPPTASLGPKKNISDPCSCPAHSSMVLSRCYCFFGFAWMNNGCNKFLCSSDKDCSTFFPNSKCGGGGRRHGSSALKSCTCAAGFAIDQEGLNCAKINGQNRAVTNQTQRRETSFKCQKRVEEIRAGGSQSSSKRRSRRYLPLVCVVLLFCCFITGMLLYTRIQRMRWRQRESLRDADQFEVEKSIDNAAPASADPSSGTTTIRASFK